MCLVKQDVNETKTALAKQRVKGKRRLLEFLAWRSVEGVHLPSGGSAVKVVFPYDGGGATLMLSCALGGRMNLMRS